MKQGPPLKEDFIDCGANTHPPSLQNYQKLVDDAVAKGARVLAGGRSSEQEGQFFQPTVLADVTPDMLIAQEETFGPILSIFKVASNSDEEAIALANSCAFALSSCAHSGSQARAAAICSQLEAGMTSVNDIEGTTYLSQSLPFGGWKSSGFERFAGPEGLRGLCHVRSLSRIVHLSSSHQYLAQLHTQQMAKAQNSARLLTRSYMHMTCWDEFMV